MSTANVKNGSANEHRSNQVKTPRVSAAPVPESLPDQGPLIAQIPDLDSRPMPAVPAKRADGRIISQALSIKLIFGVGFALVIGAILPFIFGKASRPATPVTELPEWSSHSGPGTGNAPQAAAPTWPSSPAITAKPAPPMRTAPEIILPKPAQVGDVRPATLPEPAWSAPRNSASTAANLPPPNYGNPPPANTPNNRSDDRRYERPMNPGTLQADGRNDPAAAYRNNDTGYDYRSNQSAAGPIGRDTRYDTPGNYPPAAPQGSALMPSGGASNGYRDTQPSEPGVARFDGTITPPPARTNYDRAGSSNY
jgi:hypothetical protein